MRFLPWMFLFSMFITGCAASHHEVIDDDLYQPKRVQQKKETAPVHLPKVLASIGSEHDRDVVSAYQEYLKKGTVKTLQGNGFVTHPYHASSRPVVSCSPLSLCAIELESGEIINDITLGDSIHWKTHAASIGSDNNKAYQVIISPTQTDIATDMMISTNRRSYTIGLVSQSGAKTHIAKFYYPEDTLKQELAKMASEQRAAQRDAVIHEGTNININHINFAYHIRGDKPQWRPKRVFDDGFKTFIELPRRVAQQDLPVLYLAKGHQKQLVNYRYNAPFYIIDGLIDEAYLLSGNGNRQERVSIAHHTARGSVA